MLTKWVRKTRCSQPGEVSQFCSPVPAAPARAPPSLRGLRSCRGVHSCWGAGQLCARSFGSSLPATAVKTLAEPPGGSVPAWGGGGPPGRPLPHSPIDGKSQGIGSPLTLGCEHPTHRESGPCEMIGGRSLRFGNRLTPGGKKILKPAPDWFICSFQEDESKGMG